jgi:hypothetical protein
MASTAEGRPRRIGVELERRGRYELEAAGDPAGPWAVERDFTWLKELGRRTRDPDAAMTPVEAAGEEMLRNAFGLQLNPEVPDTDAGTLRRYLQAFLCLADRLQARPRVDPTRNRALDLLPLFLHLDPGRVRAAVDNPRAKPRPALHYRLPNCEVDHSGWGLGPAWRGWLQVEHLAADPVRLGAAYARFLDRPLGGLFGNWAEEIEPWLAQIDGP